MKNKMMIRRILIGLFLGIVVTSCTHNDGYIGPLFGKWQLIEMWENGTMTPHDSLYYNFQSSVIKLQFGSVTGAGSGVVVEACAVNFPPLAVNVRVQFVRPSIVMQLILS